MTAHAVGPAGSGPAQQAARDVADRVERAVVRDDLDHVARPGRGRGPFWEVYSGPDPASWMTFARIDAATGEVRGLGRSRVD